MLRVFLILVSLLLFVQIRFCIAKESTENLIERLPIHQIAREKQWLKLLHFEKNWIGITESQSNAPEFFLSPDGRKSAERELLTNLALFLNPPKVSDPNENVLCRFPARLEYLQKRLTAFSIHWPTATCPGFKAFKDRLAAKSVSIVFSSYYLNNPSSSFGHLFLRFNKEPQKVSSESERFELLDFGINFAAVVDTPNALIYGFKGLFGLFPGTFTAQHYYYKVREYNDFESRDLWSYELALSQEEVDLLVKHLWENGPNHFPYFYLTQNCAFHILSVIEAAAPEFNLVERLPFYVIPSDSLKALASNPGLIRDIHYRASPRSLFHGRLKSLNQNQMEWLKQIVLDHSLDQTKPAASLTEPEKVDVLDAAIDYLDFRDAKNLLKKEKLATELKQEVLIRRAKIPLMSKSFTSKLSGNEFPHAGHGSMRIGSNYSYVKNSGSGVGLNARFALHDLLDPQAGYPEYAQIEFLNVKMRYTFEQKDFWLENLTLFQVKSLTPFTSFDKVPSWKFRLGMETIRDKNCINCTAGTAEGGIGITLQKSVFTFYLFTDGEISTAPSFFNHPVRVGVGPTGGLRLQFTPSFQSILESNYRYQFLSRFPHTYSLSSDTRYGIKKNWALDLKLSRWTRDLESVAGVFYYF
ncbi:MAG: hypothetical protein JWQ35_2302 [Bacteriovoracaceae bacterium]|nr:hypothetical protein [Bacteriovoracaceae bacterium]